MKLIVAHQILIGSAIGLAAIFALRALVVFARGGEPLNLAFAIAAAAVGGALWLYLRAVRAKWAREKGASPTRRGA
jgi:hypothetical protein